MESALAAIFQAPLSKISGSSPVSHEWVGKSAGKCVVRGVHNSLFGSRDE